MRHKRRQLENERQEEESEKSVPSRRLKLVSAVESVLGTVLSGSNSKLIAFCKKSRKPQKFFLQSNAKRSGYRYEKRGSWGVRSIPGFPLLFLGKKGRNLLDPSLSIARALRGLWEASGF